MSKKKWDFDKFVAELTGTIEDQYDAVEREYFRILEESQIVQADLDDAKLHFETTGEYRDPEWYLRARGAKRILSRQVSQLQSYKGRLSRKMKQLDYAASLKEVICQVAPDLEREIIRVAGDIHAAKTREPT